ncbi:glutamate receptor 2.1-like [Musa acuminata AAA Group]|uniref:glutamate receptor 2.1-like n=1 Tax=Musa acuminata AAA Group TaxID=214697 RepID=UPI0031CE5E13
MEKPTGVIVFLFMFILFAAAQRNGSNIMENPFHVGVILDLTTLVGKMGQTSISMAIDDFYSINSNYTTRLVLHTKDSGNDVVQAASAALDLIEKIEVQVIIGPQKSSQAALVSYVGNKSHVPIISFTATSPSLSSALTPYFVRAAFDDAVQVDSISSIIRAYGWREVVPVYEDSDYGRGIIPYLIDSLEQVDCRVPYRSVISLVATDDQIIEELYKLMTMQTRVFIVHMSVPMGSRLFRKVNEAGLMSQGYAWIMTDGLTSLVESLDPSIIASMQGTIGVRLYVPKSRKLDHFARRWRRRFQQENPDDQLAEPGIFALWAYDTVWTVAMAAENVKGINSSFLKLANTGNSTGSDRLGVSIAGPLLLKLISESRFRGISGEFLFADGQLQSSTFQIINVVGKGGREIGFWTPQHGIIKQLKKNRTREYSALMTDMNPVIWPGESTVVPKGWEMPLSGKKLRIGVPLFDETDEFVKVERNPITNVITVSGFCIDVFEAALQTLPYALPHEYIPFENEKGLCAGTYNDLVDQVYFQKYDSVVGDVTIRENRSRYVDFTLPYTESGIAMLVPVKDSINKNAWIFLKPLTFDLWLGSLAAFFYTGFVVWVLEHRINMEFRGPVSQQLGTIFYFSFSTLVFAHREKLENLLSRIVVIIWVFVVLILTSSYTASLTSMLTVQQLQPTVTDLHELQNNGEYVGYPVNSFVKGLLMQLNFDEKRMRGYSYSNEYVEALKKGSHSGGVAAIVHEIPYIKQFLSKYCKGYTMVGPIYKTAGFGFVFPKGSPVVPDISRGILNVTEGDSMIQIEKKWFGGRDSCLKQGDIVGSGSLGFNSFWGLFLLSGAVSTCALVIFLASFVCKNWHEMRDIDRDKSISQRLISWVRYYNKKDYSANTFRKDNGEDSEQDNDGTRRNSGEIPVTLDDDPSNGRRSISNLSDVSCPPGESSSAELASPCSEAGPISIIVTNRRH